MATVSLPKEKSYIYIIALIWLIIIIFIMFSTVTIFRNRAIYINTSHTKSKAQAQLLGENTSGILYSVDLTLLSILSGIEHQNKNDIAVSETISKTIKDQSMFLPQINNIILFNAEKKAIHSLRTFQPFELTSFEEHRDTWLEFSIKTVFLRQNKKLIVISRRIENMAGEFSGVLVATIDPIFFYDRYESYLNIDVDAVVLLDVQRNILTNWYQNPDFETLHADNSPLLSMASLEGGGLKSHENSQAIISIYQLPDFPFQISVLHLKERVLKQWYQKTKQDLVIITATVLIGIITMIMAFGQRKKRRKAEQNLIEHQNHLEDTVEKRTLNLKEVNHSLKESETRLAEAQKLAKVGHYVLDIQADCWRSSPQLDGIFGIDKNFKSNIASWLKLIHPDHQETMLNYFQDEVLTQHIKFDKKYKIINFKTKKEEWVHGLGDLKLDEDNTPIEMFGTIQDITDQVQLEKEREKLIEELQEALDDVKTLSGLLPICANCKKIRDDKGYWNNLEAYIEKYSEASFSHGMCIECSDELYGDEDWYIEMKKKKGIK